VFVSDDHAYHENGVVWPQIFGLSTNRFYSAIILFGITIGISIHPSALGPASAVAWGDSGAGDVLW